MPLTPLPTGECCRRRLCVACAALWLAAAAALPAAALPHAAQTCPPRPGTRLKYVGVFDGPPANHDEFKDDVVGATTGYTDVGSIFAAHHLLYLECNYRDGTTTTVAIHTPVRRCSYTLDTGGLVVTFACH